MLNRSTVVSLQRFRLRDIFGRNRILLLLCVFFAAGVAAGALSFGHSAAAQKFAERLLESFLKHRSGVSFWPVLLHSALSSLIFLLAVFLCGASLMGIVLVPLVVAFRGFCYGVLSALLYSSYALKGITFNAILIIPPLLLFLISLLLASREAIGFSAVIARMTLPRSAPASLFADFRNYCGRYVFLTGILLASSLADAVLSCSFLHFFNF